MSRFEKFVGVQLAEYADGDGDMAHDVLDRIKEKYLDLIGDLPECDELEPRDEKIADLIWDVMRETGAEPKFMHDEHGQLDPDGVFLAIAQKLLATGLAADVDGRDQSE